MAERSARIGFAVVCTPGGLDANVARFTEMEFEAYLNSWVDRAIARSTLTPEQRRGKRLFRAGNYLGKVRRAIDICSPQHLCS